MISDVGTLATWASATIALLALTWTLIVFSLGRLGDNRIAANSVVLEWRDSEMLIHNFGDQPVRRLLLTANDAAVPLDQTFLAPKSKPLSVTLPPRSQDGKLAVRLVYVDARGRWWRQSPNGQAKRYRHSLWRLITRAFP